MPDRFYHTYHEDYADLVNTHYYFQMTFYRRLNDRPHDHDFYEIVYVIEGGMFHTVNSVDIEAGQGSLTLLRPGDWHQMTRQLPHTHVLCLSISVEEMEKFLTAYHCDLSSSPFPPTLILSAQQQNEYKMTFDKAMVEDYEQRIPHLSVLTGMSLQFYIQDSYFKVDRRKNRTPFLEALSQFNTPENIREGVPALLRISNFSHAQLCRIMKKWMNVTPQQYVVDLRLNLALKLIQDCDLDLQSIAEQVGYSSFSHFNMIFSQRFRMTPAAMRSQFLDQEKSALLCPKLKL